MPGEMGRSVKKDYGASDNYADVATAIAPQGVREGKGKFPEGIESEIAEVRERMRSLRRRGSFGPEVALPKRATEPPPVKSRIPETARGSDGIFRPLVENANPKEPPLRMPFKTTIETGEGRGVPSSTEGPSSTPLATPASAVVSSTPDENRRKLRALAQKVKWKLSGDGKRPSEAGDLDEAFAEFARVSGHCRALCTALVGFEVRRRTELHKKMKGGDWTISHEELVKALEKAPSLMEVREWRETVAALTARLAERAAEGKAGDAGIEAEAAESDVGFLRARGTCGC